MPGTPLLTPVETARLLSIAPRTLQDWRLTGQGPRFTRLSAKTVRYSVYDVRRFLREHRVAGSAS